CALLGAVLAAAGGAALAADAPATLSPEVSQAVRVDTSRPMRDIVLEMAAESRETAPSLQQVPNIFPKRKQSGEILPEVREAARFGVQRSPTGTPAPSTLVAFNGLGGSESGGFIPPDTNGDVSLEHYIQWVNVRWSVFNKTTGARISGPTNGNSFWSGFGGPCEVENDGDPIALWDDRAQRWIMSQFVATDPGAQCFAISTTSDPLGTYHRYQFNFPDFGDYPHIGVWTDAQETQNAYLLTTHDFNMSPQTYLGAAYIAVERDKMLQGMPAQMVRFGAVSVAGDTVYGALPLHLEGQQPAPAGSCPVFMHFDPASSEYLLWDLCIRWDAPASSTLSAQPQRLASGSPFVSNFDDVAQLGSTGALDSFGTNLMYRASARAFPAGAPTPLAAVVNHYVNGGATNGGVKWVAFDLRPTALPALPANVLFTSGFEPEAARATSRRIKDEGTYAPDGSSRWMGAIAEDRSGNLGLGFSVSSATITPQLRITGRQPGDPIGTMRDEQTCTPTVTGSQLSTSGRWGDYASMSVDPSDECTFWFTSEYYSVTSSGNWNTRICSFKFPDCGMPTFDIVADSPTRLQICGTPTPADPTFALRVGVLDGFNSAVTLSASGQPAGVTPQFSPTTINPTPGTSTLTLQGANALASGEYTTTVTATSGGTQRSLGLSYGISSALPGAPTLVAPAAGATGVKVRPTLSWNAVPGALSYFVEVSTNSGFTGVVASTTITGTSWAVNVALAPSTQYFWRVRPSNYCGNGTVSATRSFTTGVPGQCPSGTTANIVLQDAFESGLNGWVPVGTGP
ncbi:MAG: fibronectin type III domain-containing protein, partial [Proteobacteria bacterium]|nr:fibronectin type III domain-containing protein [Burkholderiales bacterium]